MRTKFAESGGAALPDPTHSQAASSPVPTPSLSNTPAPGRTGPTGLSPRTSYSRVNTGAPPVSQLGAGLKSAPARGAEFLPAKTAEERIMNMAGRPTLQEMMKAAMDGTIHQISITKEASRQRAGHRGEDPREKVASVTQSDHYSSEHIEKMAAALDYIGEQIKVADEGMVQMPGKGPGALEVLQATSSGSNLEAGHSGHAISQHLPSTNPSQQKEEVQVGRANTGMETNDDTSYPEQPTSPITNQTASLAPANPLPTPTTQTKESSALYHANLHKLAMIGGWAPAVNVALIRKFAEDSINPSKIEAGAHNPPDYSVAGEGVPSQPSDVNSQVRSMLSSNEAATNYTKQQAKADPKSDVNQVLEQPALTRVGDDVLHQVFDNTGAAGVKISSSSIAGGSVKVAAARALLSNLIEKAAQEIDEKKKVKKSAMGAAPANPSAASGFNASSLG